MTLSASTVWEVRTTGADTNGGGFVAGSGGTDYSQQASAQIAVTDAVANGTTTITSATASFAVSHVGNIAYMAGGSGTLSAGWYQIVSVTNGTTAVVDRTIASGTGITLNLGGALATPTALAAVMVASNKAFVQAGTYTQSGALTWGQASVTPSATVPFTNLIGYYQTRGDIAPNTNLANRPQILCSSTGVNVWTFSNAGWKIANFIFGPTSTTIGRGVQINGANSVIINCKVSNATTNHIAVGATSAVMQCEVTGSAPTFAIASNGNNTIISENWIHDTTSGSSGAIGITASAVGCIISYNMITNCTGSGNVGIVIGAANFIINNTVYNSGGHGISVTTSGGISELIIKGNLLSQNGGYGLNGSTAGAPASYLWDGNAYFNNTSGTRNNFDDTSTNPVDGAAPYTNVLDVVLTQDPFVNKAANDFRLNSVSGGGAACRSHGVPSFWPGNVKTISYPDMGATQHQDPAFAS